MFSNFLDNFRKNPKYRKTYLINFLKVWVILVVLIYAYQSHLGMFDLAILAYGLISVIFILDSRLAASAALGGLILCPLLLFRKEDALAEKVATKVYYFLVITVATQIRELKKEESSGKIIPPKIANSKLIQTVQNNLEKAKKMVNL
jgi:hypothetical protein